MKRSIPLFALLLTVTAHAAPKTPSVMVVHPRIYDVSIHVEDSKNYAGVSTLILGPEAEKIFNLLKRSKKNKFTQGTTGEGAAKRSFARIQGKDILCSVPAPYLSDDQSDYGCVLEIASGGKVVADLATAARLAPEEVQSRIAFSERANYGIVTVEPKLSGKLRVTATGPVSAVFINDILGYDSSGNINDAASQIACSTHEFASAVPYIVESCAFSVDADGAVTR